MRKIGDGRKSDQDVVDLEYEVQPAKRYGSRSRNSGEPLGFFDTDAALDNSPFEVVARMRKESRSRERQKATANLTCTAKALPWNCGEGGGTIVKEWIHSADYRSEEGDAVD